MPTLKNKLNSIVSERFAEMSIFLVKNRFFKEIAPNIFLSGGAILSAIKNEKARDLDFFIETPEAAAVVFELIESINYHALKNLKLVFEKDSINPKITRGRIVSTEEEKTVSEVITANNKYLASLKFRGLRPVYVSNNAITMNNGVQFIFRFIGKPEDVFTTFDYEHCKTYFKLDPVAPKNPVFLGSSLKSIATNELQFSGNTRFILSAMLRMNKFIRRGWYVPATTSIEIAASALEINWSSLEVVEEELTGVYGITPEQVSQIIASLKKKEKFTLKDIARLVGEV